MGKIICNKTRVGNKELVERNAPPKLTISLPLPIFLMFFPCAIPTPVQRIPTLCLPQLQRA